MCNTTTWTTRPFRFLTPIKTFDVGQEIDVWHPPVHRARPHKNIILDRAWSNLISHTPTCHLSLNSNIQSISRVTIILLLDKCLVSKKNWTTGPNHWCSSPVCYYQDLWSGTQRCSQPGQGINYPIAEWGVKTRVWNLILQTNNTTWVICSYQALVQVQVPVQKSTKKKGFWL